MELQSWRVGNNTGLLGDDSDNQHLPFGDYWSWTEYDHLHHDCVSHGLHVPKYPKSSLHET